jgi:hypothetical protein
MDETPYKTPNSFFFGRGGVGGFSFLANVFGKKGME